MQCEMAVVVLGDVTLRALDSHSHHQRHAPVTKPRRQNVRIISVLSLSKNRTSGPDDMWWGGYGRLVQMV